MLKPLPRCLALLAALAMLSGCPSEGQESQGSPSAGAVASSEEAVASGAEVAASAAESPATGAELVASGAARTQGVGEAKRLFAIKCSGCHGANGGGGMGPSLVAAEGLGAEAIAERIREGSPTRGMPAFGSSLKPGELEALVRYVESL